MKVLALFLFISIVLTSCAFDSQTKGIPPYTEDELVLVSMIAERERAMIDKDIETAMSQFSEDATWINSKGYFFHGKNNIYKFHNMLIRNDSLDYYYETGEPRVRTLDSENAIVYYGWKMYWYPGNAPGDTTREFGLMTLNARKQNDNWQWIAVTNQHTPWFYNTIQPVPIEEE